MNKAPRIEAGSADYRRACLALVVASLVIFANLYAIHPLLPQIARDFGVSELQAGAAFTVTSLTLGLSLLVHGPVSDAVGRKLPLLAGLAATSLLTLAMAFVENFTTLIALRAALGFALGVLPAVAIAYLGDSMTRAALVGAVGLYIGGNTLGGSGGRLLGGFIGAHFSLTAVFVCMGGAGLLGLAFVARLLPKERDFTPRPLSLSGSLAAFSMHVRNPALLPAFVLGGLNFMIFLNLYTYLTFRLSGAPWSLGSGWLGLLFLTYLAGTFSASLSGRVAFGNIIKGMALGVVLLIAGSLATLATSLWLIITGLLMNAFGFFLTHSLANTWVNQKAGSAKASAASLYSVSYYFGAAAGIYYLEVFWQAGRWPAVIAAGVAVLVINLVLIWYMRRHL